VDRFIDLDPIYFSKKPS